MIFPKTLALLAVGILLGGQAVAAPSGEEAYEVAAASLTMPTSEFGSVIFSPCDTCERVTLRVDGETLYRYGEDTLSLNEIRQILQGLNSRKDVAVTVIYRTSDQRVRRILVPRSGTDD